VKDDLAKRNSLSSKTMANLVRPRLQSATEKRQTRLNFPPALAPDDVNGSLSIAITNSTSSNNTPIPTRRTPKTSPLLALGDDDKAVKPIAHAHAPVVGAARPPHSRKRPATVLADATTPDTRPPTKITVTQPHGELLTITNGVSAPLGVHADDVPSARSTPRPGSAGKLAPASSTDKRSLRSHDGGSRLKSDLATYFSSYDDIIAGVPKAAGMCSETHWVELV
jgi:hypothetical protein